MKTFKIIMLVFIATLVSNAVFAQDGATTINSVTFDKRYSQNQIETLWGKPTKFNHAQGEVEVYDYFYDKDNLGFDADLYLVYFDVASTKFKINGLIGVGDNVSKLRQLPHSMIVKNEDNITFYLYNIFGSDSDATIVFYAKNNVIYRITYDNLY